MLIIKIIKVLIGYLWVPFLVVSFIFSFDLKYDLVGVTFVILLVQSVTGLSLTFSRSVSLLSVYFVFTLVFFNLVPWLHYSDNLALWRSFPVFDSTYILVNSLILLANTVVLVVYFLNSKRNRSISTGMALGKVNIIAKLTLLSLSGLGFTFVFYMNDFSVLNLLFRGFVDEQKVVVVEGSSLNLLMGLTGRLIPVFCFLYAVTQMKDGLVTKSLLFLLMILSVFPTGVARYMVAFAYVPLLLLFVPAMRKASVFAAMLLFLMAFFFPFLNQFRYFSGFENLTFLPPAEFFYAAHFDAYENFASAVESKFVSYGHQLLGSLLFFVPRVFWPDKPVGSGYEMAERLGYSFNNISMPLLGEGYVNFGFLGVVIFAAAIGYFMARADSYFSSRVKTAGKSDYSIAIYYFMIGALFFLLRGDLMSSFAYIIAGLTVAQFVGRIMNFANSIRALRITPFPKAEPA